MEQYDCYIFAWNDEPAGGLNDLVMCCDTVEEGMIKAEQIRDQFDVVQLMDSSGEEVE